MIALIDNYDSFTYNVFQYLSELGEKVEVIRNNQITVEQLKELNPEAIVLSPGPGTPKEAGICIDVVKELGDTIPILGICLGHQAIGEAYGATVSHAEEVKHGKTAQVSHHARTLFQQLEKEIEVMRYHSLVILEKTLPDELQITARSLEDNEIMAVEHVSHPVYGVQFHPESIGTFDGKQILENFIATIKERKVA